MKRLISVLSLMSLILIVACGAAVTVPTEKTPVVGPEATTDPNTPVSSGNPAPNPMPPSPNQEVSGPLDMQSVTAEIQQLEGDPAQYVLVLRGTRPTPCHRIHTTFDLPNDRNEIQMTAVYVVDKDQVCAQVLDNYEESIQLGSYSAGTTYTVWVNGIQVGEFTAFHEQN